MTNARPVAGLSGYTAEELKAELEYRERERNAKPIKYPAVALWEVSTEGDCEGKTSVPLGCHYGHVGEIAERLMPAVTSGYTLTFRYVSDKPAFPAQRKPVVFICNLFGGELANPGNTLSAPHVFALEKWLGPAWIVKEGGSYQAFTVERR